jgi:hypothetical protein
LSFNPTDSNFLSSTKFSNHCVVTSAESLLQKLSDINFFIVNHNPIKGTRREESGISGELFRICCEKSLGGTSTLLWVRVGLKNCTQDQRQSWQCNNLIDAVATGNSNRFYYFEDASFAPLKYRSNSLSQRDIRIFDCLCVTNLDRHQFSSGDHHCMKSTC